MATLHARGAPDAFRDRQQEPLGAAAGLSEDGDIAGIRQEIVLYKAARWLGRSTTQTLRCVIRRPSRFREWRERWA